MEQETDDMMHEERHQDDDGSLTAASKRITQLEAINSALREAVSSKNAHIAMLEEKLLKMSVELASSRTREDEQRLMFRQSQLSQITMMSEDDGGPDDCTMKSSIVAAAAAAAVQIQPSLSSSTQSRFSFMPNWGSSRTLQDSDTLHDSMRSASGGGGVGGLIGNMIQLDNNTSNKHEDLRVNFPTPTERRARRRRTIGMTDENLSASAPPAPPQEQQQRRMTVVGQLLFRRGKSDRTLNYSKEEQQQDNNEQQLQLQPTRRKPNRTKMLLDNQEQSNSRLISSTVAWPTVDDHSAFGFEEFLED